MVYIYKLRVILIVLICTLGISGCFGIFDSGSDTITDNYILSWIDLQESQVIRKTSKECPTGCEAMTPPYIFSVGFNDEFIVAKQHPTAGFEEGYKIDSSITNFFIIKLSNDEVIGPLNKLQFDSTKSHLSIEDINFTMNYPEYY
ncbi:DUF3997 domain-containing protein [Marivirga sp.]|uniref:DUF3997 domain-containing protein n=1 Tax=Marivirga sp. TaxID=2018662 RepID=UPI0025DD135B|nr:DUF3997 domain-containing protein [Marivirga sp.]